MEMKKYALFAKRSSDVPRAEGDYTIWYFLNDTDDLVEATHWYLTAKANKDYDTVQLVQPSQVRIEAVLKYGN